MNITIRNIPDEVIDKIRTLSKIERRSLNNEILVLLEHGLSEKLDKFFDEKTIITKELQLSLWNGISKEWDDDRSSQEIIDDIYEHRTMGRNIEL